MRDDFKPDNRLNLARQLLKEKGHKVGETRTWDGAPRAISKTDIDGVPRIPGEVIALAASYPEWPEMERAHLDYLRSRQG